VSLILVHGCHVFSTLKGWDGGFKEIKGLMKALRLGREFLKQEGHPTNEHLELPSSKATAATMRGAAPVQTSEFVNIQNAKQNAVSVPAPILPAMTFVDPGPAEDLARRNRDRHRSQKRNNARRNKMRSQEDEP
jgi:hypothetical protein